MLWCIKIILHKGILIIYIFADDRYLEQHIPAQCTKLYLQCDGKIYLKLFRDLFVKGNKELLTYDALHTL